MHDGAAHYEQFLEYRAVADPQATGEMESDGLPDEKASRTAVCLPADPDHRDAWPEYQQRVLARLCEFRTAFQPLIPALS